MKTQQNFRKNVLAFCLLMLLPCTIHAQGTWSPESSAGFTARYTAASGVVSGRIYVMGGLDAGSTFLNTLDIFDPATNYWSSPITSGTFTGRWGLSAAVVGNMIYVMGGISGSLSAPDTNNILEVFDPSMDSWSTPTTTGTFTARGAFTSAVVNGKIYVIGGYSHGVSLGSVEVFDPYLSQWSAPVVTGTFTARNQLTSCVINNKIYVFGGRNGTNILNTLEVFDPLTNSWSTPTTTGTSTPRRGASSGALSGKMYVIGGYNTSALNTVEVFDPSTNAWTTPTTTGTFTPRAGFASGVAGGKIYAMGGQNSTGWLNTNEVFTPSGTSVKEDAVSASLFLSPNPTNGIVTVHSAVTGKQHVTITNVLGENVMELEEPAVSDFTLDLSKLPAGTYFIGIISDNSIVTRMVIKE